MLVHPCLGTALILQPSAEARTAHFL